MKIRLCARPAEPRTSFAGLGLVHAVALMALVCADALVNTPCCSLAPFWAAGLGLSSGAFIGVATHAFLLGAARLPWPCSVGVWLLSGAALGYWLADELGSWAKLDGPHTQLAYGSLAGAAVLVPLALALGWSLQTNAARVGWFGERGVRRGASFAGLGLVFVAALWADRNVLVELYPALHLSLRGIAVAAWLIGATALAAGLLPERAYRLGLAGVGALSLLAWLSPVVPPARLTQLLQAPLPGFLLDALRELGDADRDGFSSLLNGGDCAAFDADVNPTAPEIPNNGVDDNCSFGDARALPPAAPALVPVPVEPAPTSVVLITVDTLRADHMGAYGYARNTTPEIDAWARGALVFDKAFTSGGWTSIAISSLMRGVYPRRLSWARLSETSRFQLLRAPVAERLPKTRIRAVFGMPLDSEHQPLAFWLARRNMYTMAVVNDGHSQFLSPAFGCAKGFERYRRIDELPGAERDDRNTSRVALEELQRAPAERPFFLWVHYFGPHDPNTKHKGVEWFGKSAVDRYDHEIRAADAAVGVLLARIRALREQRKIAVIFSADHGEWFKTKGRQHGRVTPDVTHVPLVIEAEGWPIGRHPGVASLVDVMPTILELTQTPAPSGLDGLPLRELVAGAQRPIVFADTWNMNAKGAVNYEEVAAIDREHALVSNRRKNTRSVFRVTPGTPRDEDLFDEVEHEALWQALGSYLEANPLTFTD